MPYIFMLKPRLSAGIRAGWYRILCRRIGVFSGRVDGTKERLSRLGSMRLEMTPLIVAAVMCAVCWIAAAVAVKLQ
jgi:hypothetical protein